jgi:hypothetical protein
MMIHDRNLGNGKPDLFLSLPGELRNIIDQHILEPIQTTPNVIDYLRISTTA